MSDDDLRKYENECLEHLHILCLYNKVMKNKVTCILMEITLASNGSTVSDHALTILGELAHLHDFGIVVDEIMTVWTYKDNAYHNGETQNIPEVCGVYNYG